MRNAFPGRWLAGVTAALMVLSPAGAETLAPPAGEVILTIKGKIGNANDSSGEARFDLEMLEALATREGTMETPWTEGKVTFKGPLGRALLDAVGAQGKTLRVVALDDYAVDVPVEDFADHDAIFATRMNGKPMSVREKGPVFIVYPFDKEPALYNEKYFNRSVWQIKSVTVN